MVNLTTVTKPLLPAVSAILKPSTIASTVIGTIESTVIKAAQQYTVNEYNSDGQIVTRSISLSSLQGTKNNFSPDTFTAQQIQQTIQQANLVPSTTTTTAQATAILQKSAQIDYALCIKSQASDVIEFNTLKTPTNFDAELNYNFYIANETDTTSQEDPTQDPFITGDDVPRYVYLTWDTTETTNPLDDFVAKTQEEAQMLTTYLKNLRGNSSALGTLLNNSFQSLLKLIPSVIKDGKSLKLTDTSDLPTAFSSINNPGAYKNSASTVFNVNAPNFDAISITDLIAEKLNE